MIIRLSCTSYLLPGNTAWKVIDSKIQTVFGEYGDWMQTLISDSDEDALLLVVFLEDIIPQDILFSEFSEAVAQAELIIDSALNALSARLKNNPDKFTFIAWLGWQPNSLLQYAKKKPLSLIVAEYFTKSLYNYLNDNKRLYLIPLDILFGEEGYRKCMDSRNFFLFRTRLSQKGIKLLATSLNSLLSRIDKPAAKMLVLDCDNTLWGGIIGENGISGIQIGQDGVGSAFSAFQFGIKQMARNGLLLAISSKNEEKDVINVFENHSAMVLKKEDIVISKIDWRDKSIHIKEIASEIGIGLDSIVFWDDNPIEREKIKQSLPAVIVIDPPEEVVNWYDFLRETGQLTQIINSQEDVEKNSQYKAKAAFDDETNLFIDYNNFLYNTLMEPSLREINESSIGRAVQLVQKTNQLNLRLKRHDEFSLLLMINKPESVSFLVHLKDKFGDHGVIALVIAVATGNPKIAFLDTFLMSCRVLGRNLEGWIFDQLRINLLKHGFVSMEAEYIYGDRNSPARGILSEYQFSFMKSKETDGVKSELYSVNLKSWEIKNLEIFNNHKNN